MANMIAITLITAITMINDCPFSWLIFTILKHQTALSSQLAADPAAGRIGEAQGHPLWSRVGGSAANGEIRCFRFALLEQAGSTMGVRLVIATNLARS